MGKRDGGNTQTGSSGGTLCGGVRSRWACLGHERQRKRWIRCFGGVRCGSSCPRFVAICDSAIVSVTCLVAAQEGCKWLLSPEGLDGQDAGVEAGLWHHSALRQHAAHAEANGESHHGEADLLRMWGRIPASTFGFAAQCLCRMRRKGMLQGAFQEHRQQFVG